MRNDNRKNPPASEQRATLRDLQKLAKRSGFFRLDARARLKHGNKR